MSINDIHSLSHSKWNCKYHIVFDYSGPLRATCPEFESHHSGE